MSPEDEEVIQQQQPKPQMTLAEFGNLLREERTRNGYTVEEVESRLKIASRLIRALEDGDMSFMPHAVYAKGFMQAYAKLLGIDPEKVRQACCLLQGEQEPEEEIPQERLTPPVHRSGSKGSCLLCFIVLICLLAGGGYWVWSNNLYQIFLDFVKEEQNTPQDTEEPEKNSSATDQPEQSVSAKFAEQETTLPAAFASEKEPEAEAHIPSVQEIPAPQEKSESLAEKSAPLASPVAQSDNTASITTPSQERQHQLIVTALAECWVHSTADSTDTRQLSMQKGETFALSFNQKLVLKLGNAGGVRIKYDSRDLPALGKSGQVKTLTFPQAATVAGN